MRNALVYFLLAAINALCAWMNFRMYELMGHKSNFFIGILNVATVVWMLLAATFSFIDRKVK